MCRISSGNESENTLALSRKGLLLKQCDFSNSFMCDQILVTDCHV